MPGEKHVVEVYSVRGPMVTVGCSPPPSNLGLAFAGVVLLAAGGNQRSPRGRKSVDVVLRELLGAVEHWDLGKVAAALVTRTAEVHRANRVATVLIQLADERLAESCTPGFSFDVCWDPHGSPAAAAAAGPPAARAVAPPQRPEHEFDSWSEEEQEPEQEPEQERGEGGGEERRQQQWLAAQDGAAAEPPEPPEPELRRQHSRGPSAPRYSPRSGRRRRSEVASTVSPAEQELFDRLHSGSRSSSMLHSPCSPRRPELHAPKPWVRPPVAPGPKWMRPGAPGEVDRDAVEQRRARSAATQKALTDRLVGRGETVRQKRRELLEAKAAEEAEAQAELEQARWKGLKKKWGGQKASARLHKGGAGVSSGKRKEMLEKHEAKKKAAQAAAKKAAKASEQQAVRRRSMEKKDFNQRLHDTKPRAVSPPPPPRKPPPENSPIWASRLSVPKKEPPPPDYLVPFRAKSAPRASNAKVAGVPDRPVMPGRSDSAPGGEHDGGGGGGGGGVGGGGGDDTTTPGFMSPMRRRGMGREIQGGRRMASLAATDLDRSAAWREELTKQNAAASRGRRASAAAWNLHAMAAEWEGKEVSVVDQASPFFNRRVRQLPCPHHCPSVQQ